jgi:catechol 2,3-dioxygenase-like lactoylglutathione lyase family enzyme
VPAASKTFLLLKANTIDAEAPFHRIDHVQLAMPPGEEERARAFYVGVLGLEEIPKPPELVTRGGAWFRSGEVVIHLGVDQDFHPATKAHPAFRCVDYTGLLERLRGGGATIALDEQPFQGRTHSYITDPFGNRIELIG